MMKLKFLGAAGTVTGSSYVLTSGSGQSIVIDLGMFQGVPSIDRLNYQPYDYDCSRLSGAVLTHAHLDHCGRLPILLPKGFEGSIFMTAPTRDLTELALLDAAKVAKQDKKEILFDKDLALRTVDGFKVVEYSVSFQVGDFQITMRDAGHILGSASLEITDTHPNSQIQTIVFSGDLGNSPEDLVKPTEFFSFADAVVIESTYGDRVHPSSSAAEKLQSEVNAIEASGGTLLIPAFSLEKTQALLHMIMHLKKDGKIADKTPIFLDSPMGEKATEIYGRYPEVLNVHISEEFSHGTPFEFPGLEVIYGKEASDAIHTRTGPKVILAGSGMMTGGRILGHAAHYLPMNSTRLLTVGFQGEGTLGRQLLEESKEVMIDKIAVPVKATINSTQAMSSHADQSQLIQWLKQIKNVKKLFITHGEDPSRTALAQKVKAELGIQDITLPQLNDEVHI